MHSLKKCALCDYSTIIKKELLIHKKSHASKKTFMCTICGFVGSYKNRSHHVKTHSNEVRPKEVKVPCTQCYKPICKSNMSRHLRKCSDQMEAIRYILLIRFTYASFLLFIFRNFAQQPLGN